MLEAIRNEQRGRVLTEADRPELRNRLSSRAERFRHREAQLATAGWVITEDDMQAELDRMARQSRMPDRLQQMFAALGNEPAAAADCLARPALVERAWAVFEREGKPPEGTGVPGPQTLHLPVLDGNGETGGYDAWRVEAVPEYRFGHVAVWTGAEMLVWGGNASGSTLDTGGRYDPATDSWQGISTLGAPSPRSGAVGVWTGEYLVVWGGRTGSTRLGDGGRYDPAADVWLPISQAGAPSARDGAVSAWTGTEVLVWGGRNLTSMHGDGGRYNPASDSWAPMGTEGAPSARNEHEAVWSGGELIVWGGMGPGNQRLGDGARYNPVADRWVAVNPQGAPSARNRHSLVWSGEKMIVFGGRGESNQVLESGGLYDPVTDQWTSSAVEQGPGPRENHKAVWTGHEMIVWGGNWPSLPRTGARFDPESNSWSEMSVDNAPVGRSAHSLLWTGDELIVWGGSSGSSRPVESGGRYDPAIDQWLPMADSGAPPATDQHIMVWTGAEMLIWGGHGSQGWRYDPAVDLWTPMSSENAPAGRIRSTGIWTGSEMIVWGGIAYSQPRDTGGRYDPLSDSWQPTSLDNAPAPRHWHSAVWTGSEMIVWGGLGDGYLDGGGRYDPLTDSWISVESTGAPEARGLHAAVWTGTEMIVWGGRRNATERLDNGGRYDPLTGQWQAVSQLGAPSPRHSVSAVWTGQEMLIWSGNGGGRSGGRYDPRTDSWMATSTEQAPSGRNGSQSTIWTGSEMIVWSGWSTLMTQTGGRYEPAADTWQPTSLRGVPSQRAGHKAVWTGSEMLAWGGGNQALGVYDPAAAPPPLQLRLGHADPSPSITGQMVTVTVELWNPAGALPLDGMVEVSADSGESCTDPGPPAIDGNLARFSCQLSFETAGPRELLAAFSSSLTHPDSDSLPQLFIHRVLTDEMYAVGGQTVGLAGSGLVLTNNLDDSLAVGTEGPFQFDIALRRGQSYAVAVALQPQSPRQTCQVTGHAGTIGDDDVDDVVVSCQTLHYNIGGVVSGLDAPGLVLELNNSDSLAVEADGAFVFPGSLPDASNWVVTVAAQPGPPAQTCTVGNGEGVLDGADVNDVTITCETNLYRVGGTISGLTGSGLVLQNNGGDDRPISGNGSFHFPTRHPEGTPYDVTVHAQPVQPVQTCSVSDGSGELGDGDVASISVDCVSEEFVVTPMAGSGGTLSPDQPQYVAAGTSVDFELLPAPGHGVGSVSGSCPGQLLGGTYRAGPVLEDCTVEVPFVPLADGLFRDRFEND